MSNINKTAVLNPFTDLTTNILDYVPRATTSEFGIVAIGSGINVDNLGRIYLDTQEYSDRLTAIEAQAASSLATQQTEVAAAIVQVNLTQSQTITALTLEVNNLKTNLTDSITTTQTELIDRAGQLAQDVTDITQQLTQDKAAFTQEIQDALDYLNDKPISEATQLALNDKVNKADVISVAKGGTGATTAANARTNLGLDKVNNTADADKPVSTQQAAAISASSSSLTILIKDSLRQSVEVASGGEQTVLYTAKGQPTYMNIIKKYDMSTIDPSLSGTHPAFIVNGVEKPEIFVGTYQGRLVDGELLSLPNVDPSVSINFDNFSTYARACGAGHHLMTNAEWSAVALQCYKNDTQPFGNTYYGRSSENPLLIGRRQDGLDPGNTAGTVRTLTGSGPVEWRHNRKPSGIADLAGNVWEWSAGMRLMNGEIQVIADNNAALHTIDMSATSAQWKAIDAVTGNLVTPDGNGTTAGTVKYADSGTADYTINGAYFFGAIRNLSTTNPVSAAALARLKALCLYPVVEDAAKFNSGYFGKVIDAVERTPIRGGRWSSAANAGVFVLNLVNARSRVDTAFGARPAFVNP